MYRENIQKSGDIKIAPGNGKKLNLRTAMWKMCFNIMSLRSEYYTHICQYKRKTWKSKMIKIMLK